VTWTARTNSEERNWQAVATSSNGAKVIALEENGYLYKSTNSGYTWTQDTIFSVAKNWYSVFSSENGLDLVATAKS
jgi:hypothetical protein